MKYSENHDNKLLFDCFADSVERHGSRHSHSFIVEGEVTYYTFFELMEKTLLLEKKFESLGLNKFDKVCFISENSVDVFCAYLALQKINCICAMIDSSLPKEDIAKVIDNIKPQCILLDNKNKEKIEKGYAEYALHLGVEEDFKPCLNDLTRCLSLNSKEEATPNSLSTIMFSSGTTGSFKSIGLSYNNIISTCHTIIELSHIGVKDRILALLPISHSYGLIYCFLSPLLAGSCSCFLLTVTPHYIFDALQKSKPTIFLAVPALLESLANKIQFEVSKKSKIAKILIRFMFYISSFINRKFDINIGKYLFYGIAKKFGGKIREMYSGGSHMDVNVIHILQGYGLDVYQGYALSETTCLGTSEFPKKRKPGTVGLPMKTEVKIDKPDEKGVGEVCLSGKSIMLGYYNDEEATKQVIKEGWFHTGDLGFFDEDNFLVICGRIKDIIVTPGGKNVSPEDIEMHHKRVEGISDISVFGVTNKVTGNEVISAAIVISNDFTAQLKDKKLAEEKARENIALCSAELPPHFQIQKLYIFDEFPKTMLKKNKKKLIKDMVVEGRIGDSNKEKKISPPKNKQEAAVLEIWQSVFPKNIESTDENFFNLGGTSMLFADLLSRLGGEFGFSNIEKFPYEKFLSNPTIAHMTVLVDEFSRQESENPSDSSSCSSRCEADPGFKQTSTGVKFLGGCYQAIIWMLLPIIWGASAFLIFFTGYEALQSAIVSKEALLYCLPLAYSIWAAMAFMTFVALKWLIVGRYKEGEFPIYSMMYYRWWTVTILFESLKVMFRPMFILMSGTILNTLFFRALGAKIGCNVIIKTDLLNAFDLVTIGKDSTIAGESCLMPSALVAGNLSIQPIVVGASCKLGVQSSVLPGETLPEHHVVLPLSTEKEKSTAHEAVIKKPFLFHILQICNALFVFPFIFYVSFLPAIVLIWPIEMFIGIKLFSIVAVGLLSYFMLTLILKWLVLGRQNEEEYSIYGARACKKQIIDSLLSMAEYFLMFLGGTYFYTLWLRLCGAKIGKNVFMITEGASIHADFLKIDDDCFLSTTQIDSVIAGGQTGYCKHQVIHYCRRGWTAYRALVEGGAVIKKGAGVAPKVQVTAQSELEEEALFFGDKSYPHDQPVNDEHSGSHKMKLLFFSNNLRIIVLSLVFLGDFIMIGFLKEALDFLYYPALILLAFYASKIYFALILVVSKWLSIWKFRQKDYFLWDGNILMTYLFVFPLSWFVQKFVMQELKATPFLNGYLRMLGVSVGKNVHINASNINDFDLIEIGDHSVVNEGIFLSGHLLRNGLYGQYVRKKSKIGEGCTIGLGCLLFPGANISDNTYLHHYSPPIYYRL